MAIADNKASRDAVLGRVRKALKVEGNRDAARAAAQAVELEAHVCPALHAAGSDQSVQPEDNITHVSC